MNHLFGHLLNQCRVVIHRLRLRLRLRHRHGGLTTKLLFCHRPDISESALVDFFTQLEVSNFCVYYVSQFKPKNTFLLMRWIDPWPRGKKNLAVRFFSFFLPTSSKKELLAEQFGPELIAFFGSKNEIDLIDKVAYWILNRLKPDLIVCWGFSALPYGPLGLLGKEFGVTVYNSENSIIPKGMRLVTVDGDNTSYSYEERLRFLNESELIKLSLDVFLSSHYLQRRINSNSIEQHIFRHIDENPVYRKILLFVGSGETFHREPVSALMRPHFTIFPSYSELFQELTRYDDILVIYKPHPSTLTKVEYEPLGDGNIIYSNANVDELIKISDEVISHGSHLELNVLLQEKPLILLGNGFFFGSGLALAINNIVEFREYLCSADVARPTLRSDVLRFLSQVYEHADIFFEPIGDIPFDIANEVKKFVNLTDANKRRF